MLGSDKEFCGGLKAFPKSAPGWHTCFHLIGVRFKNSRTIFLNSTISGKIKKNVKICKTTLKYFIDDVIAINVQGNSKLLRPPPRKIIGGLQRFGAYS